MNGSRMPRGIIQDKVIPGQGKLSHWKKDRTTESKKRKEVEDKSPETTGNHKRKKQNLKGKQQKTKLDKKSNQSSEPIKTITTAMNPDQPKEPNPEEDKQEEPSIADEVKKLNPDLQRLFKLLDRTIQPLRSDVTRLLAGNSTVSENQRKIVMLEEENVSLKRKLKTIERSQEKTRHKVDQIESRLLEGNVIMQGLAETEEEGSMQLYGKVVDALSYTIKRRNKEDRIKAAKEVSISTVKRIGRKNPSRVRPVVISFVYKADAINLLENKKKLPKGIYVDREYPEDIEERRRYLRPILRAARQHPKYKGLCRMDQDVLVIDSTRYTKENLHKLPKKIDSYHSTSKRTTEVVGFFGELNPFSNFHEVQIEIDGIKFHSTEQWIQYQKAKLFGDHDTEEKILNSKKAIQCKRLSYEIDDYSEDEWKKNIEKLCYRGIKEKFLQHEWLQQLLIDTGNKTIVECAPDSIWGTGIPLKEKDALSKDKWKGIEKTGLMGQMLMRIREELRSEGEPADSVEEESMEAENTADEDDADTV